MKNSLPTNRHSDARRDLVEVEPMFSSRAVKILRTKEDCELGRHLHKKKHEMFCLAQGAGEVEIDGVKTKMAIGEWVFVRQGMMHAFRLKAGSVLVGLASQKFDPTDDYKYP